MSTPHVQPAVPATRSVVDSIWAFNDWYMHRIPGGAGLTRPRQAINLHKLSVAPLTLALMFAYENWTMAAWLYLALHGVYGMLWCAKDVAFGDSIWRREASVSSFVATLIYPLGLYYLPVLLILTPLGESIPGGWGTSETLPVGLPAQRLPFTGWARSSTS